MSKGHRHSRGARGAGRMREGCSSAPLHGSQFLSLSEGHGPPGPLLQVGVELDRFKIQRHLGAGRFANVYLARDTVREQDVAIKVVDVGPEGGGVAAERIRQEYSAYDRIQDHRHVLKVHDVHSVRWGAVQLLVLSMEYADGGTLRDWLVTNRLDYQRRCDEGMAYSRQMCEGVAAAHDVGLIHLDLKPENVLFVGGVLKLSDFGLSFLLGGLGGSAIANSQGDRGTRGFGTPAYMSPEQFRSSDPANMDTRADIYSLGVILHELLDRNGQRPFGGSYEHLCLLHTQVPPPELAAASEDQRRIVATCLAKRPGDRYQTIDEFLADLDGPMDSAPDATGQEEEADGTWEQACRSAEEGDLNQALRLCRHLCLERPDHTEAVQMSAALQERFDQAQRIYSAIEQFRSQASLDELAELLVEAVETWPNHPAGQIVQPGLVIRSRQYWQAMRNGVLSLRRGDWETAGSWFEQARSLNPGAPQAEMPCRFVERVLQHRQEAREFIDMACEVGDGPRAMALARELDEYLAAISQMIPLPDDQDDQWRRVYPTQ